MVLINRLTVTRSRTCRRKTQPLGCPKRILFLPHRLCRCKVHSRLPGHLIHSFSTGWDGGNEGVSDEQGPQLALWTTWQGCCNQSSQVRDVLTNVCGKICIWVKVNSDSWVQARTGEPTTAEGVGSSQDAVLEDWEEFCLWTGGGDQEGYSGSLQAWGAGKEGPGRNRYSESRDDILLKTGWRYCIDTFSTVLEHLEIFPWYRLLLLKQMWCERCVCKCSPLLESN